jgi:hypothetical protein
MKPVDPNDLAISPRGLANLRIIVGALMIVLALAQFLFTKHPSLLGLALFLFAGAAAVISGVNLRRGLGSSD